MIFFAISLVSLVTLFLFIAYSYPSSSYPDWMSEMWSHMGGGMMGGTNDPYLGYFGVLFIVLIAVIIVSVVGLTYFLLFPELKTSQLKIQRSIPEDSKKPEAVELIRRTLNKDEKKFLRF